MSEKEADASWQSVACYYEGRRVRWTQGRLMRTDGRLSHPLLRTNYHPYRFCREQRIWQVISATCCLVPTSLFLSISSFLSNCLSFSTYISHSVCLSVFFVCQSDCLFYPFIVCLSFSLTLSFIWKYFC